jgi:hypothetical protein
LVALLHDLQVKSSPPAQPASLHNDPAIIQVNVVSWLTIVKNETTLIMFLFENLVRLLRYRKGWLCLTVTVLFV